MNQYRSRNKYPRLLISLGKFNEVPVPSFDDNMTLEWSDRKHMIEHPSNRTAAPLKMIVLPESFGAAINRTIHGSMKKGEMIRIVCRTPYKTGKVKHPSALSPATSEKSFVTEAPNRYKANIPPSTQASTNPLSWSHDDTSSIAVDPAVDSSSPYS